MTTSIYHYVYRITNMLESKHYYGVRTCKNIEPEKDIGIKYISSSLDKSFISEQKVHPEKFKYKVIRYFSTRESAVEFEIILHNKFDIAKNPKFYNKSKQTSVGWDTSGYKHSAETKKKMSKSANNRSIETKINMSNAAKNRYSNGRVNPLIGRPRSKETILKMSESNKGKVLSDYTKKLISESMLGESHHRFSGYYITPFGKYPSIPDKLFETIDIPRKRLCKYCKENIKITIRQYNASISLQSLGCPDDIIGKYSTDLGFIFETS